MQTASRNPSIDSPENNFPELVIPYMDFNNLKALPKVILILREIVCISTVQLHKYPILNFSM